MSANRVKSAGKNEVEILRLNGCKNIPSDCKTGRWLFWRQDGSHSWYTDVYVNINTIMDYINETSILETLRHDFSLLLSSKCDCCICF